MEMESGSVYDDSRVATAGFSGKNEAGVADPASEVLDSIWVPSASPLFHGSTSMMSFEENNMDRPFFVHIDGKSERGDENFDGYSVHQPEKKRRLLPDQVQILENCFEVENKLEPERKVQLAKDLGLQPRQVAIWFQNRRARYKTKHLEKEYDILIASYDKLKADYGTLHKENEKLKEEVESLSGKYTGKAKQGKFDRMTRALDVGLETPKAASDAVQDAASSARSDVFDSDSPHYRDGNNSALMEPADSSHAVEPTDHSDLSQDEDDNLSRSLLSSSCLPKLEIECFDDLQPNSCNLGFPIQNQGTWFWPY